MQEKIYKKPFLLGILVAAIIHSIAILTRELSPVPVFPIVIDALAFNGTWIYIVSIGSYFALNLKRVRNFFIYIPRKITSKIVDDQKLVLAYEFIALTALLFIFPAVTYFYAKVHNYFSSQNPLAQRFIDYMPFTDLINRAMTSFPFFITLFTLVSLLCVIMPHTYLAYKCAKKSPTPLHSAISFSVLLSVGITAIAFGLLALSIEPWMLIILVVTGPVVLLSFVIINIMMLRYHGKFVLCNEPL